MATAGTTARTTSGLKGYEDMIAAKMAEAKAKLEELEAKAREKGAQAEIATVSGLKTAKQNIDRKLQDLKGTHDSNVARARADIDADVATFKASVDELAAKFKTVSRK